MKLSGKTLPSFCALWLLGMVVGGLAWELAERVLTRLGFPLDLSVGPVGFDLSVIALQVKANPGTFIGLLAAALLSRRL